MDGAAMTSATCCLYVPCRSPVFFSYTRPSIENEIPGVHPGQSLLVNRHIRGTHLKRRVSPCKHHPLSEIINNQKKSDTQQILKLRPSLNVPLGSTTHIPLHPSLPLPPHNRPTHPTQVTRNKPPSILWRIPRSDLHGCVVDTRART